MKLFYIVLFLLFPYFCIAQDSYQFGVMPAINLNKKLRNDFSLNFRIESRQLFKTGQFEIPGPFDYKYVLTDFSTILSKKIAINKSLTAGYLIRMRDGRLIHRSIQQFVITKAYERLRLAHRFSSDQTFGNDFETEFRLRYRVSLELPLNGQSVDPKEFYLKVNNEYLGALQGGMIDLELRIVPFLGFEISDTKKIELGLDYRKKIVLDGNTDNRFWIGVNWYQSF